MKKLTPLAAVIAVAALSTSTPTHAGGVGPSFFELQPVQNAFLCLEPINGLQSQAGDPLILLACNAGGSAAEWYRDGQHLHWAFGDLCADVGVEVFNGGPVNLNNCITNDPGQVWVSKPLNANAATGRIWTALDGVSWCLTAEGLGAMQVAASAGVVITRCDELAPQRWIGGS